MQMAWLGLAVLLTSKAASADMGTVSCPEPIELPCSNHCTQFGSPTYLVHFLFSIIFEV